VKLADVQTVLQAKVIYGEQWLDKEVVCVCGADLMSDVLVYTKEKTLLLTGLTNVQVIRTAEMSGLIGIVFVRGKMPGPDVLAMARSKQIPLLMTKHPMFEACGMLYQHGLRGCSQLELIVHE